MRISVAIARALLMLLKGSSLPSSGLRQPEVRQMIEHGVLQAKPLGAGRSRIVAGNPDALEQYIRNHFGISDLAGYIRVMSADAITRADLVLAGTSSKQRSVRTFRGFPVQTIHDIHATLNGAAVIISPVPGTCWFIQDYENFLPEESVTIIGIENGENFQRIKEYGRLFSAMNPLFVSRYPQSGDLINWLQLIPNNYLHFGDLDFEGIRIFLHEYHRHLPARSRFYVPKEAEKLLQVYGNRGMYMDQAASFKSPDLDTELAYLVTLFHRYGKVLEQEAFIRTNA